MSRRIETALVVDDDAAFRTALGNSLRRRGVAAHTAASAEEGLFLAEDRPFDLLVMDQRMPGGEGLTALGRYRRLLPEGVIVMLTGHGDIPLAVAAVREGADTLLTKPVDPDLLLRVAGELRRQPRQAAAAPQSYNLEQMEREAILAALKQCHGIVARAAKLLGIDRRTLQRKMKRI